MVADKLPKGFFFCLFLSLQNCSVLQIIRQILMSRLDMHINGVGNLAYFNCQLLYFSVVL